MNRIPARRAAMTAEVTFHGFAYGALGAGQRLGVIPNDISRAEAREWLDRIEDAAGRRPDLARAFPTNDRAKAAHAHEALAQEVASGAVEQQLTLWP